MQLHFTQYLMPNGRKKNVFFEIENSILVGKVETLLEQKCYFECEMLQTGKISLTCMQVNHEYEEEETLAIEVCENGPEVVNAVARLIENAYIKLNENSGGIV